MDRRSCRILARGSAGLRTLTWMLLSLHVSTVSYGRGLPEQYYIGLGVCVGGPALQHQGVDR